MICFLKQFLYQTINVLIGGKMSNEGKLKTVKLRSRNMKLFAILIQQMCKSPIHLVSQGFEARLCYKLLLVLIHFYCMGLPLSKLSSTSTDLRIIDSLKETNNFFKNIYLRSASIFQRYLSIFSCR